jgi:plasmid stability protein
VILLANEKHAEARKVLEQAVLLDRRRVGTQVYLAEVLVALGLETEAKPMISRLQEQRDHLTPDQDDRLMALKR